MNDHAQSPDRRSRIIRRLDDLPVLPSTVTELSRLNPGSEGFAEAVARIACIEPSIAARVIRIANASQSGPQEQILSLTAAITRMGARPIAQLITSMSVVRVFVAATPDHINLWRHALQVAVIARDLVREFVPTVDPEAAYIAGLLHDIGRFLVFEHDPQQFSEVNQSGWTTPETLLTAENAICGINHAEVGAQACEVWGLPTSVSELLRHHHATVLPGQPALAEVTDCLPALQQADHLSCVLMNRPRLGLLATEHQRGILAATCLRTCGNPVASAMQLVERLPGWVLESDNSVSMLELGPARAA